jgi:hypothetical protein
MPRSFLVLLLFATALSTYSQSVSENSTVQISTTAQASPPKLTLRWKPNPGSTGFTVQRRAKGATTWGASIASLAGSATQWVDNNVVVGQWYEYQITRSGNGGGSGFTSAGIQVPAIEQRGTVVLLVDNAFSASLASEITELIADLRGDGWNVERHNVSRTAAPAAIRSIVLNEYNAAPEQVKAVYLLGRIPIPYSGNVSADGHSEHKGAWPADGYYGDVDGTWTDASVNTTQANSVSNRNIPGDGKFDQNDIPTGCELQVGRVDLRGLTDIAQSEVQLLRSYLQRAHSFKRKEWTPQERAIVFDNLQYLTGDYALSGLNNLAPAVGYENISYANPYGTPFVDMADGQSCLWTYACGGGLSVPVSDGTISYYGCHNVGTTADMGTIQKAGVFNMVYGSYFGDWDNVNNWTRGRLAGGEALVNVYSAKPHWWFQHTALGETVGYAARASMNNENTFVPATVGGGDDFTHLHMALMGDPSLRTRMLEGPTNLVVTNAQGKTLFTWTASAGTVEGYHIYRFNNAGQPVRVNTQPITGTSWLAQQLPFAQGTEYMVRAVKLETSASGTYYNLSIGDLATAGGAAPADCAGVSGGLALPGTPCNDGNANTGNDTWSANCVCVGLPLDCAGVPGGTAVVDDCGVCGGNNGCIGTTVCVRPSATDIIPDAEEALNGNVYANLGALDLVLDSEPGAGNGTQITGIRFPAVSVPQDASITSAYIQFTARGTSTGTCNLEVAAHRSPNAPAINWAAYDLSSRTPTNRTVEWTPASWTVNNAAGQDQRTPDLKKIVRELVLQPTWQSGNAMVFLFSGTGGRKAYSHDISTARSAELCITYTTGQQQAPGSAKSSAIQQEDALQDWVVYPNPTHGHVRLPWAGAPAARVQLWDALGRMAEDTPYSTELALDHLAPGAYVLVLIGEQGFPLARTRLVKK